MDSTEIEYVAIDPNNDQRYTFRIEGTVNPDGHLTVRTIDEPVVVTDI